MIINNEVLISKKDLQKRVKQLAMEISRDYHGDRIYLIGILNGAAMFMMDLCRHITVSVVFDFISVKSYSGSNSSGKIKIIKDASENIKDKHVIIVEDIYDTGLTLKYIKEHLLTFKPASIKICVLLNKNNKKSAYVKIDYQGFNIPDRFVVGYGLAISKR